MSESIGRVNEIFGDLKSRYTLVAAEKHGGALRNSYAHYIPESMPDVVLADTKAWSPLQPPRVFAAEDYVASRSGEMHLAREHALEASAQYINSSNLKPPVIYSWFHSQQVEALARKTEAEVVVSRDERVCSIIEDKSLLSTHLEQAGCTDAHTPRHEIVGSATELPSFERLREVFGLPFVLQGRSMGGDGTFIVASLEEYRNAHENLKGAVRISEFIDAPYSSIYCLSLPDPSKERVNTFVDVPSYKPVDIKELGIGNVAGAGGDWRSARGNCDMLGIISNVEKLAELFYEKWGYFGHFVVEGFHKDGQFLFNEINARPGGGSEVNGTYQLQQEAPSFTSLHILGRLGLVDSQIYSNDKYNQATIDRVTYGSEGAMYLKYKNTYSKQTRPSEDYKGPGIYKLDDESLVWQCEGIASYEADIDKLEFLIANGPRPESSVAYGKQICSIEATGRQPILNDELRLNPLGKRLALATRRLFDINA